MTNSEVTGNDVWGKTALDRRVYRDLTRPHPPPACCAY